MSTSMSTPSLEPYFRARTVNPSTVNPSTFPPPRTLHRPHTPSGQTVSEDFLVFLYRLLRLIAAPITIPVRLIHHALTSPLTVSLVLKLVLLGILTLASAVFSILAVGAFWYSWGTGGAVEVEGWLFYGSKSLRTPHVLVQLPSEKFQEDLKYDVEVEMELVRPGRGDEALGNFMLSLDLRSSRNSEITVIGASQPSLPPLPLISSLIPFALPHLSTAFIPPCVLPWPFRSFCPSRLLGYDKRPSHYRSSPAKDKDVVLLTKNLLEGVVLHPSRGGDATVGSAFVSIGREDSFADAGKAREVRTTGWVVIRFTPRPSGIRWLLSSHPLPPLLLLPPISLGLTLSSSVFAFLLISYLTKSPAKTKAVDHGPSDMSEASLLAEKRRLAFENQDEEDKREAERRREEWEEVESSALGMGRMPEGRKRSVGGSTVGGSETTAPTTISGRTFDVLSTVDGSVDGERSDATVTESVTDGARESETEGDTESEAGR